MKDEKIVEYFRKDKNFMYNIGIAAHLNILAKAIIEKGWITEENFNKLVNETTELLLKESVKTLDDSERQEIEFIIKMKENEDFDNSFFK